MNMILTIISGLIVLNIVIIVHEFGHYITAKKAGVYAPTFAIGFGPTIWKIYKNKETSFELKAIPFGGYVRMASNYEGDELEIPKGKKTLEQIPKLKQIWIISAGAVFNFGLTIIIYFLIGLFVGHSTTQVKVEGVKENYPAYKIIKANDIIVSVNNKKINNPNLLPMYIQKNNTIEVIRNKELKTLKMNAILNPENKKTYMIGIITTLSNLDKQKGVIAGVNNITDTLKNNIDMQIATFSMLFSGQAKISDLNGPVGIIKSTGNIVASNVSWSEKIIEFFNWLALISFAIGFANLFLFILPVVDGGRIFLIILSAIFRKDLSKSKITEYLMMGCIALMLAFFVYITFIDLFRQI